MMRNFWPSASALPAPKLKASTNQAATKCFIDAPPERRLLPQVGSSPAVKAPCILPNRPVVVRLAFIVDLVAGRYLIPRCNGLPACCRLRLDLFVLRQLQLRLQQMQLLVPVLARVGEGDLAGIELRQHRVRTGPTGGLLELRAHQPELAQPRFRRFRPPDSLVGLHRLSPRLPAR